MGEHDDLDAVVRHAFGHALVGGHHAAAEILVLALDRERAAAVPDPVGELWWRILPQPGDEEVEDLLVLHRVAVRWVGDEDVVVALELDRRGIAVDLQRAADRKREATCSFCSRTSSQR